MCQIKPQQLILITLQVSCSVDNHCKSLYTEITIDKLPNHVLHNLMCNDFIMKLRKFKIPTKLSFVWDCIMCNTRKWDSGQWIWLRFLLPLPPRPIYPWDTSYMPQTVLIKSAPYLCGYRITYQAFAVTGLSRSSFRTSLKIVLMLQTCLSQP